MNKFLRNTALIAMTAVGVAFGMKTEAQTKTPAAKGGPVVTKDSTAIYNKDGKRIGWHKYYRTYKQTSSEKTLNSNGNSHHVAAAAPVPKFKKVIKDEKPQYNPNEKHATDAVWKKTIKDWSDTHNGQSWTAGHTKHKEEQVQDGFTTPPAPQATSDSSKVVVSKEKNTEEFIKEETYIDNTDTSKKAAVAPKAEKRRWMGYFGPVAEMVIQNSRDYFYNHLSYGGIAGIKSPEFGPEGTFGNALRFDANIEVLKVDQVKGVAQNESCGCLTPFATSQAVGGNLKVRGSASLELGHTFGKKKTFQVTPALNGGMYIETRNQLTKTLATAKDFTPQQRNEQGLYAPFAMASVRFGIKTGKNSSINLTPSIMYDGAKESILTPYQPTTGERPYGDKAFHASHLTSGLKLTLNF